MTDINIVGPIIFIIFGLITILSIRQYCEKRRKEEMNDEPIMISSRPSIGDDRNDTNSARLSSLSSRIDHHPRMLTVNIPPEQDQRHSNNVTDDLPKYCELDISELPTYDSLFNVQGNNFSRKSLSIRTNTGMHNRFLE